METENKTSVTVEVTVNAKPEKAWNFFTGTPHIVNWYHASDDWHAPKAENDMRVGGHFKTNMAAKDGSMSFDFEGDYTGIKQFEKIEYEIADGRKVWITFKDEGDATKITETFETESINPIEMQKGGWQSILNNFKKYVEKQG
jgi:uncharacterized protein YndB with AHSA1/START domain